MNTWLIITACIHNRYGTNDQDKRKKEYYESLTQTLKVVPKNVRVVIVENSCNGSSYLDRFGKVFYSKNNNLIVANKGIIEFKDIQDTIKHFSIPQNDIIVKLTGRYSLFSDSIFNIIQNTRISNSAWVKFFNVCTQEFMYTDCILGCYAIRVQEIMKLDPYVIGRSNSMEVDFALFLRNLHIQINELNSIGVQYRFFDSDHTVIV
jgi:hypothetical protein